MNFERLKKWLPLAGALTFVWLAAYVVFWLDRSECTYAKWSSCLVDGFGNWLGDVVMLQWVKGYQTLLSGIAAIVAGFAVYAAYIAQRADILADRARELRAGRVRALNGIRLGMLDIANLLALDTFDKGAMQVHAARIRGAAADVMEFSSPLAREVLKSLAFIEHMSSLSEDFSEEARAVQIEEMRQIATVNVRFLANPNALLDEHCNFVWRRLRGTPSEKIDADAAAIVEAYFADLE